MDTNTPAVPRIFKIGATRIVEDASMAALTNEQVGTLLKASYPEVAHATIRERIETTHDGEVRVVEWLPQPGRKG
ncbi:MAG: hypothetical protein ABI947_22925 [Chloroflexota bacterium]